MVSKQRIWQKTQQAAGKYTQCGQPRGKKGTSQYCKSCKEKRRKYNNAYYVPKTDTFRICIHCRQLFLGFGSTKLCSPECKKTRQRERTIAWVINKKRELT